MGSAQNLFAALSGDWVPHVEGLPAHLEMETQWGSLSVGFCYYGILHSPLAIVMPFLVVALRYIPLHSRWLV